MIAALMIIIGGASFLFGVGFTVYIALSPLFVKILSINGKGEIVENSIIRKKRKRDRKYLLRISVGMMIMGLMLYGSGYYLGYADRGNGHWLYKMVYKQEGSSDQWDRLTSEGKFAADDGREYAYYLMVRGDEYEFCGEKCADINELREKLLLIKRENTIMLIDSYAVAESYHEAEQLLKELGIEYETEEV